MSSARVKSGLIGGSEPLSLIDTFEYPIPIDAAYVFRRGVDATTLDASLRETLRAYPAFAGRLTGEGAKLSVDLDDRGAGFVTATTERSLEGLDRAALAALDLKPFFARNAWLRCRNRDVPLLMVQHTAAACGGMVLAVQAAHALTDGEGLVQFMRDWARVHTGGSPSTSSLKRADYDAHFGVRAPAPEDPDRVPGFKRMSRPMLAWKVLKLAWDSRSTVSVVLAFHREELARMKREAGPGASASNALLAHVWRIFARLRPNPDGDPAGLFQVVGTRHLRDRPVDPAYFGNAVWHVRSESTYGAVRAGSLAELTPLVQDAQAVAFDVVRDGMQWLANERARGDLELGVVPDYALMRGDFFATNIAPLPVYEPDFGTGRACWVSTMEPPVRWMIRVSPSPDGDGVDVHCTVPRAWRARLASPEVDADLHRYDEARA